MQSVKKIFNYYKQHQYKTIVMGASFRNVRTSSIEYGKQTANTVDILGWRDQGSCWC